MNESAEKFEILKKMASRVPLIGEKTLSTLPWYLALIAKILIETANDLHCKGYR